MIVEDISHAHAPPACIQAAFSPHLPPVVVMILDTKLLQRGDQGVP